MEVKSFIRKEKCVMILNSLCALALGFVLDMLFGSPKSFIAPGSLIKNLIKQLSSILKGAYADSSSAQNAAGGVLVVVTLFVSLGLSIFFVMAAYKLSAVFGIIVEGLLCWSSISVRDMRISATSVYRTTRIQNEELAAKRLKKLIGKNTDGLEIDEIISVSVESVAKKACTQVCAPIFYILLFGGIGGMFYKTVNLLDEAVGYKNRKYWNFGRISAKLDDLVNFIPARITALLLYIDSAFLKLNSKNAKRVYSNDKKKTSSPNSGQMVSVCAGALGVCLYNKEYNGDNFLPGKPIGKEFKPLEPQDIYWTIQLYCGSAALAVIFTAILKVTAFVLFK